MIEESNFLQKEKLGRMQNKKGLSLCISGVSALAFHSIKPMCSMCVCAGVYWTVHSSEIRQNRALFF
jgi:hypothetical protein